MTGGLTLHEIAEKRELTKLLQKHIQDEERWDRGWKYCKKLASFTHTPVTLKEYLRMEKFAEDEQLVQAVYEVIKSYEVPKNWILTNFDAIGYFYSIALLSVTKSNRKEYLCFLQALADEWCEEKHPCCSLLYRNMKRLVKRYPDLKEIELKLAPFAGK